MKYGASQHENWPQIMIIISWYLPILWISIVKSVNHVTQCTYMHWRVCSLQRQVAFFKSYIQTLSNPNIINFLPWKPQIPHWLFMAYSFLHACMVSPLHRKTSFLLLFVMTDRVNHGKYVRVVLRNFLGCIRKITSVWWYTRSIPKTHTCHIPFIEVGFKLDVTTWSRGSCNQSMLLQSFLWDLQNILGIFEVGDCNQTLSYDKVSPKKVRIIAVFGGFCALFNKLPTCF